MVFQMTFSPNIMSRHHKLHPESLHSDESWQRESPLMLLKPLKDQLIKKIAVTFQRQYQPQNTNASHGRHSHALSRKQLFQGIDCLAWGLQLFNCHSHGQSEKDVRIWTRKRQIYCFAVSSLKLSFTWSKRKGCKNMGKKRKIDCFALSPLDALKFGATEL